MSFEFRRNGKAKSVRAWRGSNDGGVTWSGTTDVGAYVDTTPTYSAGQFASLTDDYELVELGLNTVNNAAGSTRDQGFVVMTIELRNN